MTRSPRRDEGLATAEVAVALPALVVLVAAGMTAVSVLTAQLRCVDAAREAARAAARGETGSVVRAAAARAGPEGSVIEVAGTGEEVRVTVTADTGVIGGLLPSFQVRATAVGLREPEAVHEP